LSKVKKGKIMVTRKKPTIKYEKNLVTNKTTIATPKKVIKDRMEIGPNLTPTSRKIISFLKEQGASKKVTDTAKLALDSGESATYLFKNIFGGPTSVLTKAFKENFKASPAPLKKVKDKTRKKQKDKKDADKRIKDYKKGKQTFRGQGGR